MSKYISIEYDEPNLKGTYRKPEKPSKDNSERIVTTYLSAGYVGSYGYGQLDQKYRDQEMQNYECRMQEYERQMQEWEDFKRNPYFFQKRTALIDVENKDFKFLDEVIFYYRRVFPQIKVFNQKNRKSFTLTFKDNEQYQKAKSQIIQAIT